MAQDDIPIKAVMETLDKDIEFLIEKSKVEFVEVLSKRMEDEQISRGDLAKRLNTNKSYITKILQGNAKFTLNLMVKIAEALDCKLTINLDSHG